ncbi:SMP-30/gluconolactonase/LRE family protein [Herbiconiux sp. P15]|uniref:SMP-30/gluconolactonase/LRE family protein n=1 Tax=Herbiconiux liukaitaii TaxID=3342799 RepID=UPI0035B84C1C
MTQYTDTTTLAELVDPEARFELLAEGFGFAEGPIWRSRTNDLLFSDVVNSRIHRWSEADGVSVWRSPSNMSNGQTLDPNGDLLTCEHYPAGVRRTFADGSTEQVAHLVGGVELNSPNDVVCRSDGTFYFTDPPSGRSAEWGFERPQDLEVNGVYLVRPSGEIVLVVADLVLPNGLALSPDESVLYVDDTTLGEIRAYDVAPDGTLSGSRLLIGGLLTGVIADGVPDGMKVDERGNIYCTGPGGIWVMRPDGELLGVIQAPETMINFTWGGQSYSDLYLCGITRLFRLPMRVRGAGLPGSLE